MTPLVMVGMALGALLAATTPSIPVDISVPISLKAVWPWSPGPALLYPVGFRSADGTTCPEDSALLALGLDCGQLHVPELAPSALPADEAWLDFGDEEEPEGYTQDTGAASAGATECDDNAPHAAPNCNRPIAEESDWHLADPSTDRVDHWRQRCREAPEELAATFETIAARSGAFEECAPLGCDRLAAGPDDDARSEALRALLVLWLDVATGSVAGTQPVDRPGLSGAKTVQEAIAQIERTVCDRTSAPADLSRAAALAGALTGSP